MKELKDTIEKGGKTSSGRLGVPIIPLSPLIEGAGRHEP
jgi:hypothetical protein